MANKNGFRNPPQSGITLWTSLQYLHDPNWSYMYAECCTYCLTHYMLQLLFTEQGLPARSPPQSESWNWTSYPFPFPKCIPSGSKSSTQRSSRIFLFLLSILSRRRVAIPATVMACCPSGHADTHGPESGKGREARGKAEHWYDLQAFMSFHCFLLGLRIQWNFSADNKHSVLYILLLVTPKNPRNIIFFYKPSWSTQLRYCFLCVTGKHKSTDQGQLQQF